MCRSIAAVGDAFAGSEQAGIAGIQADEEADRFRLVGGDMDGLPSRPSRMAVSAPGRTRTTAEIVGIRTANC